MPNHPKIPEHERFRHNAGTGEDEFRLWDGSWIAIDKLRDIGHASKTLAYKGHARAGDCENAARCAHQDKASIYPHNGPAYEDCMGKAWSWAAWGKEANQGPGGYDAANEIRKLNAEEGATNEVRT